MHYMLLVGVVSPFEARRRMQLAQEHCWRTCLVRVVLPRIFTSGSRTSGLFLFIKLGRLADVGPFRVPQSLGLPMACVSTCWAQPNAGLPLG
jgi:hypothetical protein